MIRTFSSLALILLPVVAYGGPIADLLREGVFGVAWGAAPADVEAAFPGGKWQSFGKTKMYSVPDGRTVFGVERTPKQHIIFGFTTSERLNAVSVEYPGELMSVERFGDLLAKTTEVFGQPIRGADAPETFDYSAGDLGGITATQVLWPTDEGITVNVVSGTSQTLFFVKGQLSLNISYNKIEANTKEELGLGEQALPPPQPTPTPTKRPSGPR
jgi:hypothetical protein